MIKNTIRAIHEKFIDYYGFILFFAVWQAGPSLGWIDPQFIPPPSDILVEAYKISITGDLFIHTTTSLFRVLVGLLMAIGVAVPLGFILGGWFPKVTVFLHPLLNIFGQINAFSLFPIFILAFGIGETAKLAIIFWSAIWPVFFNTISGVKNVDPLLIKSIRSMGAGKLIIFAKVILPGAARSIFTGLQMGARTSFLMIIAAEMLGSSAGLGWLIYNSSNNNVIPRLFVGVLVIALLGYAINYLIALIESSVITWKEDVDI
ncbi:binding-protein-dependent transport systems inner membrane component [Syntrophobotulus glycolicus DSM 8271]|uniref:Binding-protein-dependent transport systems inner membrane component n=1 Tax=Syntrophobotulus glycolicus (strain DSM 8271 / FlGlyR) TaxID=645991 RepID=F0SXX6_SYNGF|nr:ABC transporter permease [Syntrophobotulus glycolicus]ADY57037.1 binding-protein-dependent transport systems inner membrane component [Syntrophobotulus glycolicus DSM 8271]